MLECARRGDADLRQALVAEGKARTATVRVPEALIDLDCEAFARAKVAPMVRGLFPIVEPPVVLDMLARSLVFLTPSTIEAVLNRGFPSTAWDFANLACSPAEELPRGEFAVLHFLEPGARAVEVLEASSGVRAKRKAWWKCACRAAVTAWMSRKGLAMKRGQLRRP